MTPYDPGGFECMCGYELVFGRLDWLRIRWHYLLWCPVSPH